MRKAKLFRCRRHGKKIVFWLGAGSGAGGMAIAAALAFFLFLPTNAVVVSDLAEAHQRSLVGEHLIDVASSDHHTVKPWFAGHSDVSPPAEDFKADGFTLVGGRADYVHARARPWWSIAMARMSSICSPGRIAANRYRPVGRVTAIA